MKIPEDENLPDGSSEDSDAPASDTPAGEGFAPGSTVEFDEPTLF